MTLPALRAARRLVWRRAEEAGLGDRSEDFMLAVNEVLSNSLQHAGEGGTLRLWLDAAASSARSATMATSPSL